MPNVVNVNVHAVLIGRGAQTLGNIVKFLSTEVSFMYSVGPSLTQ